MCGFLPQWPACRLRTLTPSRIDASCPSRGERAAQSRLPASRPVDGRASGSRPASSRDRPPLTRVVYRATPALFPCRSRISGAAVQNSQGIASMTKGPRFPGEPCREPPYRGGRRALLGGRPPSSQHRASAHGHVTLAGVLGNTDVAPRAVARPHPGLAAMVASTTAKRLEAMAPGAVSKTGGPSHRRRTRRPGDARDDPLGRRPRR